MIDNLNIFQIYIQDCDGDDLPTGIQQCISTIMVNKSENSHYLLGNEALREIIKSNLGSEVILAYDSLVPYTYKSDLGRHCLLYLFGGWYFDSTVTTSKPIPTNIDASLVVFKDAPNPGMPSWDLSTAVIYGKKGHKVFELMIQKIIFNVKNNYYGTSPLSPTGPTLFGKCLAELGEDSSTITGMLTPLTPLHQIKNHAFIIPNGEILAYGKKSWGTPSGDGLSAFTASGTNSYNELYYKKNIYKIN
jgi:mannosyltransferase OCH1-like enzyme